MQGPLGLCYFGGAIGLFWQWNIGLRSSPFADDQGSCVVVFEVSETTGCIFQSKDHAVEYTRGVGDTVTKVTQKAGQMMFEYRRRFADGPELAADATGVRLADELVSTHQINLPPKAAEFSLYGVD